MIPFLLVVIIVILLTMVGFFAATRRLAIGIIPFIVVLVLLDKLKSTGISILGLFLYIIMAIVIVAFPVGMFMNRKNLRK